MANETLIVDRPSNWTSGKRGKAFRIWQREDGSIRVARHDPKGWMEWEPKCTLDHFLACNPNLVRFKV